MATHAVNTSVHVRDMALSTFTFGARKLMPMVEGRADVGRTGFGCSAVRSSDARSGR
jgi:hypothetical protein